MILFAIHLAIALILGYVMVRAIYESGKKELIIPVSGIVALFIIHCVTSQSYCLECSISEPRCVAEMFLFWIFAGWAIAGIWLKKNAGREDR